MKKTVAIKKTVAALALAALMLVGTAVPASAATATFKFTHSGNTYGLTTQATSFPSYVTAWAKVTNKSNGTYKDRVCLYRHEKRHTAVKEQWNVFENHHEPLVSEQLFEAANARKKKWKQGKCGWIIISGGKYTVGAVGVAW